MKNLIGKNLWIAGAIVGLVAGFLYWKYVGCLGGTCTITSKPINSMAYFSVLGGLVFSIFQPKKKAMENDELDENSN